MSTDEATLMRLMSGERAPSKRARAQLNEHGSSLNRKISNLFYIDAHVRDLRAQADVAERRREALLKEIKRYG